MPTTIGRPAVDWERVRAVYADGGVVGRNPSPEAGTWAFCYADAAGERVFGTAGHVTPAEVGLPAATNNLTELLAVLLALEQLPDGWGGAVFTDSLVTLRRVRDARRAKFKGVPGHVRDRVFAARDRLGKLTFTLLGGHPSRKELAAGVRADGMPVSVHNCWCDSECGRAGEAYRASVASPATADAQPSFAAV